MGSLKISKYTKSKIEEAEFSDFFFCSTAEKQANMLSFLIYLIFKKSSRNVNSIYSVNTSLILKAFSERIPTVFKSQHQIPLSISEMKIIEIHEIFRCQICDG